MKSQQNETNSSDPSYRQSTTYEEVFKTHHRKLPQSVDIIAEIPG